MAVTLAEVGAVPSALVAGRAVDALAGAGEVWPFGSVARGESAEDSDIDLAARFAGTSITLGAWTANGTGPAGRAGSRLAGRCDGH